MEQVRNPSASTQRVDANRLLFDKNKAWTKEIWPFETAGASGIAASAKAPRRLGGLSKQKCVLEVL